MRSSGKYGTARRTTDNNVIRHMHIACWIIPATNTHTKYNTAFPHEQWFCELVSLLHLYVILPD
jgi:hypothetical protein